jgi:hypothetical protein
MAGKELSSKRTAAAPAAEKTGETYVRKDHRFL